LISDYFLRKSNHPYQPLNRREIAMTLKIILVDINPKLIEAWEQTFEENPEVEIHNGSMLDQIADAWVTPTNSRGHMGGGLDAVIKKHLGAAIEARVQQEIRQRYGGSLPVGYATCVPSGANNPRFLISTPTMTQTREDISGTLNVALACAAVFQAVHMQNEREPDSIGSVALPGLGARAGQVPAEICADLMWTAYNLFQEQKFSDFATMRAALEEQLGDLGPAPTPNAKPRSKPASPGTAGPVQKKKDIDFDDFD
jgi:O-acetyl-ADP-ribose deacetylase (regulator of RNase III)